MVQKGAKGEIWGGGVVDFLMNWRLFTAVLDWSENECWDLKLHTWTHVYERKGGEEKLMMMMMRRWIYLYVKANDRLRNADLGLYACMHACMYVCKYVCKCILLQEGR